MSFIEFINEFAKIKLTRLVDFLKSNNEYYRKLFCNFKSIDDFFEIPFLTRDEIYRYGFSGSRDLVSKNLKVGYIFSTGGTTGKPKYIGYTFEEFEKVVDYLYRCYSGIEQEDIVANLFMAGNMWSSFLFINRVLEKRQCTILPISGNTNIDLMKSYVKFFKPNCIVGIPSQIIQVVDNDSNFIEKIYYGGEMFLKSQEEFLYGIGCKMIKSGGYASVDADIVGFQCHYLQGTKHHIFVEHQIVELVSLDGDEIIDYPDKVGQIVVTNLDRYLCPIIRYKTGDLGRWVKSDCDCSLPTIELLGRFDDWIRLASYDFYYQDFAEVFYPHNIALKINRQDNLITVLLEKQGNVDLDYYLNEIKKKNWQLEEGLQSKIIKLNIEIVQNLPRTNKKINVIYE